MKPVVVAAEALRQFAIRALVASGVSQEDSELTADNFIQANLRGEDSHGVHMLPIWVGRIKAGGINPRAKLEVVREGSAAILLDANYGVGQAVAVKAMEMAIQKARTTGFALAGVRHCNSYGNAKYAPMRALQHRMVGLALSPAGPTIFPPGGLGRKTGTNPIAIAVPAGKELPVVLDMSVATVAMEKVRQAARRREKIPLGWAVDKDGNPTDDPAAAWDGSMLTFGGYKGFGLGVMVDLLAGVLMGAGFMDEMSLFEPHHKVENRGMLFGAINIEHFIPYDQFVERVDAFVRSVKESKLKPGVEEVFLPGEHGFRKEMERRKRGIPLDSALVEQLKAVARELDVMGIPGAI